MKGRRAEEGDRGLERRVGREWYAQTERGRRYWEIGWV